MYCIVVLARKKITKSQVLLNRDEMCRKNNVSFVELVDLYKLKLRQEMNEAYCSARDYPPSVVAVLDQQNKGKARNFGLLSGENMKEQFIGLLKIMF